MRIFGAKLACISALSLLAACGSPEVERRMEIALPDAYAGAGGKSNSSNYAYRWWEGFGDPVLNKLIETALAESPTSAEAAARLREAEALARASRNWPLGEGEIRTRTLEGTSSEEVELDVEWNLFGGRRSAAAAALARLEAAGYGAQSARIELVSELASGYVELRYLQQARALRFLDLRSRQQSVETLLALSNSGDATRLDIVRARALVAETRAEIPDIEAGITARQHRIATLAGRPLGRLGIDLSFQGRQPAAERAIGSGVPADLVRRKPEIRQAEALYAAAVRDVDTARGARYPSLTLSGNIIGPLDGGSVTEAAIAGVALPIFQQPVLAAREDAAHARVEQAYARWTAAVLTAVEDVEAALSAIRGTGESVRLAGELVSLNAEAHDLVREQLSIGSATVLELLDSERAVTRARVSSTEYRRNHALATIALYRALGVGVP